MVSLLTPCNQLLKFCNSSSSTVYLGHANWIQENTGKSLVIMKKKITSFSYYQNKKQKSITNKSTAEKQTMTTLNLTLISRDF